MLEREFLESRSETLGLFTLAQWREAGFSDGQLANRIRKGQLVRVFNRVFAVGGATWTPDFMIEAGVMRAGPVAAAYGSSAAAKHGWVQPGSVIHIATTRQIKLHHRGFKFHRVALRQDEIARLDGVHVTDAARTMIDACGELSFARASRIFRHAKRLGHITDEQLRERIRTESRQGRPGLKNARLLLERLSGDYSRLMSDLEARFIQFLANWGFSDPLRNISIEAGGAFPWRADFFWPKTPAQLIVELDDYFTHGGEDEWRRDREKDLALETLGFTVVRITREMLDRDERMVALHLGRYFPGWRASHKGI